MQTEALVNAASPIIGQLGGTYFFTASTLARGKELGLDGMRFYFLGRGAPLGDVEWPVVVSAFGFFNPKLIDKFWNSARTTLSAKDAAPIYRECTAQFGRENFASVQGIAQFCEAAELIVRSADPAGLPLFAGQLSLPLADDLPGRAAQLVTILREHRGSAHVAAVIAVGLEPRVSAALGPEASWRFHGWTLDDGPEPTDADRHLRIQAEELTNRVVNKAFAVLTEAEGEALLAGLRGMQAAMPTQAWAMKEAPEQSPTANSDKLLA
ncbi:MAG: hypothetical protein Q7L55_00390 [Actinomycetota bacterium]|nr:hypothetical protein [Actinomycetota bacterium]